MDIFDKVKDTITETSQDVVQKARDTSESMKLNTLNKTKEKEIEKVIYQVGIKYYMDYRNKHDLEFEELFQQIEKLQMEIEENKQTIERLKNVACCAKCGKRLEECATFCIYCGTRVVETVIERKENSEKKCVSCGKEMRNDAKFCIHCGTAVVEKAVAEIIIEPIVEPTVSPTCKKCGEMLEENTLFCTECGQKVE